MPLPGKRETVTIRDAALIFKNFKGEGKQYNREGDRNFSIMIGEEHAADLERDGWNVKPIKRREEDDEQLFHLKIKVSFGNKPPRVFLISNVDQETGIGRSRTMLGEGMVGMLDDLESTRVDLVISPYNWEMNDKTGRTAYLQSLYFTMYEDELEQEYAGLQQVSVAGDGAPKHSDDSDSTPSAYGTPSAYTTPSDYGTPSNYTTPSEWVNSELGLG